MFAVIKTGGKQYRVAEDQMLQIEKIQGEPGQIIQLGDVLMLGGDQPQFGSPTDLGRERRRRGALAGPRRRKSSPSRSAAARIRGASAATGRNSP